MKYLTGVLFFMVMLVTVASAADADAKFILKNNAIIYNRDDGGRERIDVHKKCTDLWIAPDESVITFVGVDKENTGLNPLILASSIYVATKSSGYLPARIPLKAVKIQRRLWTVFRHPSIDPDRHTIYFVIPYSMTTWKVLSSSFDGRTVHNISDAVMYCVLWGGLYSGSLLIQQRMIQPDPNTGVTYPCELHNKIGQTNKLTNDCWDFTTFARLWSKSHGATCTMSPISP